MKKWLNTIKIYADKRMVIMLLLGFVSGLPFLLVSSTLSLWLKELGVSLTTIGLFSLIKTPYSFKWLFSPIIDQYSLPFFSKLGRRRGWAIFLQILLILSLIYVALTNPKLSPVMFIFFVFMVALFSAAQDIVLDAYRIESFNTEEQGASVAIFVLGYRIGLLFSGAGALFLASIISWSSVYLIMAGGVSIGTITILFSKEPKDNKASKPHSLRTTIVNAIIKPFSDFMKRDKWLLILLFIFFYRMSDSYVAPMTYPFFDDIGFTKIQIATIIKIYGIIATILGTLIGGIIVKHIGLAKALFICGILQGLSNLVYVGQVYAGNNPNILMINIFIENISGGMGTSAFVAYLSSLCNKKYTATQYALLSSFMGVARDLFASSSGFLANILSWQNFFITTTLMSLPGMIILYYLIKTKVIRNR